MNKIASALVLLCFSFSTQAGFVAEKDWGIAAGFRIAKIPFKAKENQVADFIPLIFYKGDTFFIRGLTGGAHLYTEDKWQISLLARYRYFDIPAEAQNLIRGNALDTGVRIKYNINEAFETDIELMTASNSRRYATLNARYKWQSGAWELFPYATLRIKNANFNNHFFGLDGFSTPTNPPTTINNKIGSGIDLTIGSEVRYHVISNFYLLGRAQFTALDSDTRQSVTVEDGSYGEVYLGIAFFNDISKKKAPALKAKPYFRLAHGWATPSNLSEILNFNSEDDPQNNQLTSLFYGHPVADSLFGIDAIDIYITTGFTYHHTADPYQQTLDPGQGINTAELVGLGDNPFVFSNPCAITYNLQPTREYVLGVKAYYNFHWPIHWRFGLTEGLSYIETVSNIEQREMDKKGYRSSNLVNYIDITVDFSLGDMVGVNKMNDIYLGIGIHHRSSIFETSSAFGRIKGGSNYNTLYLQYHF